MKLINDKVLFNYCLNHIFPTHLHSADDTHANYIIHSEFAPTLYVGICKRSMPWHRKDLFSYEITLDTLILHLRFGVKEPETCTYEIRNLVSKFIRCNLRVFRGNAAEVMKMIVGFIHLWHPQKTINFATPSHIHRNEQ